MESIEKYVKENDIKGYLSYCEDLENLKKYIDIKDYEEELKWNENVVNIETYIDKLITQYNYEIALENEDTQYMLYLIYGCEFDIEINKNSKLDLIDLQGVYLGEDYDNFETIAEVLGRLSGSYLYNYYGIDGIEC